MTHSDPISDMLTRIRNGLLCKKKYVRIPYSKIKKDIAEALKKLGFINLVEIEEIDAIKKELVVKLKYVNRDSAIHKLERFSKPGCRTYHQAGSRVQGYPQHSVIIYSTNKGVLTAKEAKEQNVGGEPLCIVW